MKDTSTFIPHPSVANGDVDKIKHWVGQCKNVDEVDENDRTPLHWAVMHNRIEIAKILLKKNANPSLLDSDRFNALHYASAAQNLKLCELLLSHKANPATNTNNGSSCIMLLVSKVCEDAIEQQKIIQAYLKGGCNINASNDKKQTALHLACINSSDSVVKMLLQNKANPNALSGLGEAPVHFAVLKGRKDVFQTLSRASADILIKTNSGETPLDIAEAHQKSLVPLIKSTIGKLVPWVELTTKGKWPVPRVNHCTAVYNNRLYIIGGENDFFNPSNLFGDLSFLNGETLEWQCLTSRGNPPPPICRHSSVLLGHNVYVFGGYTEDGQTNNIWILNLQIMEWSHLSVSNQSIMDVREAHTAVKLSDTEFLVFGGSSDGKFYNDIHVFDTNTNTWKKMDCTGPLPEPRHYHSASIIDDKMYIFGGTGSNFFNDIHILDLTSWEWKIVEVTGEKPIARIGHASAVISDRLILIYGGIDSKKSLRSDICAFDTETMHWIKYSSNSTENRSPFQRVGHSLDMVDGALIAFGGHAFFSIHELIPKILDAQVVDVADSPRTSDRNLSKSKPTVPTKKRNQSDIITELQDNVKELKKILQEQMGFAEFSPVLQKCIKIEELSFLLQPKQLKSSTSSSNIVVSKVPSLNIVGPTIPPKPSNPFNQQTPLSPEKVEEIRTFLSPRKRSETEPPKPPIPTKPNANTTVTKRADKTSSVTLRRGTESTTRRKHTPSVALPGPKVRYTHAQTSLSSTVNEMEHTDSKKAFESPSQSRSAIEDIQKQISSGKVRRKKKNYYYKKLTKRIPRKPDISTDYKDKKKKQYSEVLNELVTTEESYLRSLAVIIGLYKKPLENEDKGIVIDHYMALLFSNVEELFELNLTLYNGFIKSIEESSDDIPSVAEGFSLIMNEIGKYNVYCTNQNNALESIDRLISSSPVFVEYIDKVKSLEESRQEDLSSYLTKPFQRITRYPLLLAQLIKYSTKGTTEYTNLEIIKERVDSIVYKANEAKRMIDSVVKMIEIQSSFTWQGDEGQIKFSKDCKYILEGKFKELDIKTQKLSKRNFFLFSDMIVTAKPVGKKYKKETIVPLESCIIWDIKEGAAELPKAIKYAFTLVRTDDTSRLVMCASSQMEKDHWIASINSAISSYLTPDISLS